LNLKDINELTKLIPEHLRPNPTPMIADIPIPYQWISAALPVEPAPKVIDTRSTPAGRAQLITTTAQTAIAHAALIAAVTAAVGAVNKRQCSTRNRKTSARMVQSLSQDD
jgi:hypothetical protein